MTDEHPVTDGHGMYVSGGESFERDTRYIASRITRDGRDGWSVGPGRYRLVVSRACPAASQAPKVPTRTRTS